MNDSELLQSLRDSKSKLDRALRAEKNVRQRCISLVTPNLWDEKTRECPTNARALRVWKRWKKCYRIIQEVVSRRYREIASLKSELRIA